VGVEVVLHLTPSEKLLNYGRGLGTYYEVKHTVDAFGAADISFVGSSRGRESVVMPLLSELLNPEGTPNHSVANYSCPGSSAADIHRTVKHLLDSDDPPELLIYFLTPRVLRGNSHSVQRAEVFGIFPDKFGDRPGGWLMTLTEEPVWRFRNRLGELFRLFRHRYFFRNTFTSAVRRRGATQPMQGGYTIWQRYVPNRSLVNTPISDRQIRNYVNAALDENGNYVLSDARIESLRKTLELTRERGVRTILVETPISPDLQRHLPDGVTDGFMEIIDSVRTELGVEFVSVEQLGVEIGRENFREQSHLNRSGGDIMTRAIAERIVLPHLASGAE